MAATWRRDSVHESFKIGVENIANSLYILSLKTKQFFPKLKFKVV